MAKDENRHLRLRRARENAGYMTARELEKNSGWNNYGNYESGTTSFSFKKAQLFAKKFKVRPEWLYSGTGSMRESLIPIIGKAAAGPDGSFIDDYATGAHPGLDPFDPETDIAVEIEGTSMVPRFRPREIAIFGKPYPDPLPLLNREVLVQTDDGRQMIKILRRNSEPGLWDLHSINSAFEPIEGVRVEWARPLEGLRV